MNAPSADPGLSFDVTEADFRQTVLERSLDVPVLLDCWAPWCGPCRNLKPVLEKLVQEYGGRFVLAKLNTDDAPQISAALQIRSIPLAVLFVGGRPVDQFQGALPEGQVRAFLEKHLGEQVSEAEALRAEAAESADAQHAEMLLSEALRIEPANAEVALDLATRWIARDEFDGAEKLLNRLSADQGGERRTALLKRIELARNKPEGDPAALAARIAANPRTSTRASRWRHCRRTPATSTPPSTSFWRWCCATRPSGARRRGCNWSSGSRCAPTRRPSAAAGVTWACT
jgi:putative thioredoxin